MSDPEAVKKMSRDLRDTFIHNKREEQSAQYHFTTQITPTLSRSDSNIQVDDDDEEEEDVIED